MPQMQVMLGQCRALCDEFDTHRYTLAARPGPVDKGSLGGAPRSFFMPLFTEVPSTSFWCEMSISLRGNSLRRGALLSSLSPLSPSLSAAACVRAICLKLWVKIPHPTHLPIPSSP